MKEDSSNKIVLNCQSVIIKDGVPVSFYFAIPPQNYVGGITITVVINNQEETIHTDNNFEAERSKKYTVAINTKPLPDITNTSSIPDNQIWYCTVDNTILSLGSTSNFSSRVVSHSYYGRIGIIEFDKPLTSLSGPIFAKNPEKVVSLLLPNSITSIRDEVCTNMSFEYFHFPNQLKEIRGYSTFENCKELKEVILPEGFEVLGDPDHFFEGDYFAGCSSLRTVFLPSSLIKVGVYVFRQCNSIQRFDGDCRYISDDRTILYESSSCHHGYSPLRAKVSRVANCGQKTIVFPEGTEEIQNYAIEGMEELESISFPDSFWSSVTYWSIINCSNLLALYGDGAIMDNKGWMKNGSFSYLIKNGSEKSLISPEGATMIKSLVYGEMPELEELELREGVSVLEDEVIFGNPKLKKVIVPSTVSYLGYRNFELCPALNEIYMKPTEPPVFLTSSDVTYGHEGMKIFVPSESIQKYKDSEYWVKHRAYLVGYDY